MPFHVPGSLDGLLSLLEPCFSQPTFQTLRALVRGFIGRVGEHTVTGMWQAARLAGRVHHSRGHDFFASRRWDPDDLGLRLLDFLVTVLVKDGPVRLAVDDTLFGRSGKRVWGAHYLHDGAQPEGSGRRTRWGNCWVVVVLVVSLPCTGGRPIGLPVLFRLFRPRTTSTPTDAPSPSSPRELIDLIVGRLKDRTVKLVMDGAYASRAWQGLPARVTLTTRMRSSAALYQLDPPPTGKCGRPALKGPRLPSLAQIAATVLFEPVTITGADGRARRSYVHRFQCLWYGPLHTQPISVLLIRNPGTETGFDIALASTDTTASTAAIISGYDSRWTIETCHQEAKANGVGEARNRVQHAVERTVPFGFLCQTITIAWYQLYGDPDRDLSARRRLAPWYQHKQTVSYSDMLAALRRELIRAEFHAQAPRQTTTPQFGRAPSPSALTAA